jgi:tetratricopeptide (TPR) repeat protein
MKTQWPLTPTALLRFICFVHCNLVIAGEPGKAPDWWSHDVSCKTDTTEIDACNWRIYRDSHSVTAYCDRGRAHRALGSFDAALADYEQAIHFSRIFARAYFGRGGTYADMGDLGHAVDDFEHAARLDPNCAAAYAECGYAYAASCQWEKAIAEFSEAINVSQDLADALLGRAIGREQEGDLDGAIGDYSKTIGIDPKNAAARLSRGTAFARKGDLEKASADFSDAAQLCPILALAIVRRGPAYAINGDWDNLAGAFFQRRRLFPAIAQWRAAIRLHPDAAGMIGVAAWVLATGPCQTRNGNEKQALDWAQTRINLNGSQDPAAVDVLAAAYRVSRREADAVRTAKQALAMAEAQHNRPLVIEISAHLRAYETGGLWFDAGIVNEPR